VKNIPYTIIILGIITLCELFYGVEEIEASILLWFGYGIYRGIRYIIKNNIIVFDDE
jgi:hypothetical protein